MDIETNPGPFSDNDKDEILNATARTGDSLRSEIRSLQDEMRTMKNDRQSVFTICNDFKSGVDEIDKKQIAFESNIVSI